MSSAACNISNALRFIDVDQHIVPLRPHPVCYSPYQVMALLVAEGISLFACITR